jgi:hypothetical protein
MGHSDMIKIAKTKYAIFLLAVIFSLPAMAAEKLAGIYNPPQVGSQFEFDTFKVEIVSIDNRRIGYNSGSKYREFTSLFITDPSGGSKIRNEENKHAKLWPLKVGNYVEFEADNGRGTWLISTKVVGTETIKVAGEEFFTFKIEVDEEGTTHSYRSLHTIWWSPQLGVNIKSHKEVTRGTYTGRVSTYELLSYRLADAAKRKKSLVSADAATGDAENGSSVKQQLLRLKKLFDSELITESEYKNKKQEILSKM